MTEKEGSGSVKRTKGVWSLLALCAALCGLFVLLFFADNKYETPPPYGRGGVFALKEADLAGSRAVFLIDGWLLRDDRAEDLPTWIGEFSNLQRGDASISPHGTAFYTLKLRYTGAPITVAAAFPELFSDYTVSLDGTVLARGQGNGEIVFSLSQGEHVLTVETVSRFGYYSGMYYPPALGTPDTLSSIRNARSLAYALAFLVPLALALFTLLLWRSGGAMSRWFALLCCFYALYVSWYFVQLFHLPVAPYWFLAENLALYGLCFCVVRLTALASGGERGGAIRCAGAVMLALPAILLALCLLIPILPWAVIAHGLFTNFYYVVTFAYALYFTVRGSLGQSWERRWTAAGCAVFGAGLVCNLFFSNRFEPIRFFWQFEWCGLLLAALFGGMMAARNRRILLENAALTQRLEQLVEQRTAALGRVLEERKAFFSDMAHDLKAPVFATQSFIAAIREGGIGVDSELSRYLALAEDKQREMARRLQGLSALNALDQIRGSLEKVSIRALFQDIYAIHRGEAEVAGVHLVVEEPAKDGCILAQTEKLELLFENLIYNALRATPAQGRITLSAALGEDTVTITVSDTGCGISPEELPFIFRRFYVGARNKKIGTGLGLYIVNTIAEELGGRISATSKPGAGTAFQLEFPLFKEHKEADSGQ